MVRGICDLDMLDMLYVRHVTPNDQPPFCQVS